MYIKYIKKYFKYILQLILIVTIQTVCIFITPLIIQNMLNKISMSSTNSIKNDCIIVVSSLISILLLNILFILIKLNFSLIFKTNESKALYAKVFKMNYESIRKLGTTYFITRIDTAVDNLFNLFGENIIRAIVAISTLLVSLFFIGRTNMIVLLLFLIFPPVILIGYKKLNKRLMDYSIALQDVSAVNYKNTVNVMEGIDTIKQTYNYNFFAGIIAKYTKNVQTAANKVNKYAGIVSNILEFIINTLKIIILLVCIYLFQIKKLSLSNIIFIQLILDIYFNAILDLKNINLNLRDVRASRDFISNDVLKNSEHSGKQILKSIDKVNLSVKNFSYDKNIIIKDINLSIKNSDSIALIGKSGCGKSTLVKLIAGIYENNFISINDIPLSEYNLSSLREKIYMLNQNVQLFPISIKDNITIGLDNYDKDRLNTVLNSPFMKVFLNCNNGFDTIIKENGVNFSGGQKQKIAIARLLMHDPEIIIFDESTSALDSHSENEISQDISYFLKDKIVIKISHRLSSISDCKYIVLLKDGLINKIGTYNEMLRSKDFTDLFEGQI